MKFELGWPEMKRRRRALEEVASSLESETQNLAQKVLAAAGAEYRQSRNRVNLLKKTLERQRQETRELQLHDGGVQHNRVKVELESQQAMLQRLTRREGASCCRRVLRVRRRRSS